MNWPGGEWSWLNNGHLDEIDEDLTVFASSSGVIGGEVGPGRLQDAIGSLDNPLYGAGRES
jgi:hypothetical protein